MTVEKSDEKKHSSWNDSIKTILLAVVLALTVRSFAYEPFNIPSGSMKSNLLVGDYLFVSKYSYGYSRYSFPLGIPFFEGRILASEPKRGDVVVFRFPPNPRIDYIKRLIGLPGDKVQVKEGILYINDKSLERHYVDDFSDTENNMVKSIPRFAETLPEGKVVKILLEKGTGPVNNTPEFIVPEGKYFMMGDNRDNSIDSRLTVGFVPAENLVGRAETIWFSTDGSAQYLNPISWFTALRIDRFFKRVE
ncbi:MAG: signal peptidase I [Pseudomonadota bacterium]